jgi:hypothetical protein
MNQMNLNEIIVNTVLRNVPQNVKPVPYLMEHLDLSKESAYRRLRGEIPFTMEELTHLSLNLDFSLDEIIGGNKCKYVFLSQDPTEILQSPNSFFKTFQFYDNYLNKLLGPKKKKLQMALNQLPPLFLVYFDNIFKFSYYKWICENRENMPKCSFSSLAIPEELQDYKESIANKIKNIDDCTILLSPYIFLDTIKEMQYYHQRKLLKKEELQLLKKDVQALIDLVEKVAQNGEGLNPEVKIDIYLSSLYLTSNIVYLNSDDTPEMHLWMYITNPMIIQDAEVCGIQRKWFQSLKKQSILISQSNEILQAEFFAKQREYVELYLVKNTALNFIS